MPLEMRLATLEQRHSDLETELESAKAKPAMDDGEIRELKRRKLQLKDEIERLRNS